MAGNQSRIVELTLKLNGVQTLEQLEQVTQEINQELKGIETTSKSFTQMGDLAKKANSKLKEVASSLEGVTSTEKSEAINKMGMALVGAFQGAAGASLLFGEKTGKELEGVIKKVGGLFAITDSLKKITEAFSAKNISALKGVVKGWQESTIAAKLFGNGVKTALVSTGIGALIVLLGVIIANWDKVSAAMKKAFDFLKQFFPPFQWISDIVDKITEKVGSLGNLIKGIGGAISALFKGENIADGFNNAVTAAKELDAATKAYNTTLKEGKQDLDDQNTLLEAQGNKQEEIYKNQIAYNKRLVADAEKLLKVKGELSEEEAKTLHDAKLAIQVDEIKLANYKKEYAEKKKQKDLEEAKKKIEEARTIAALKLSILQKESQLKLEKIQEGINSVKENELYITNAINDSYDEKQKKHEYELKQIEKTNKLLDEVLQSDKFHIENIKKYIEVLDDLSNKANKIKPPTEETTKLLNALKLSSEEYAKQYDLINETKKFIDEYTVSTKENQGVIVDINDEEYKKLAVLQGQKKVQEELLKQKSDESYKLDDIIKKQLESLDAQGFFLEQKRDILKADKEVLNQELQKEIAVGKSAKTELELLQSKDKQLEIQNKINGVTTLINDNENKLTENAYEYTKLYEKGDELSRQRLEISNEINRIEVEQGKIIAANATVYLNSWQKATAIVGKYIKNNSEQLKELGQASIDLAMASYDLAIQNAENEAQKKIELAQAQYDAESELSKKKFDEDTERQKELADNAIDEQKRIDSEVNDLNSELADANGERYDEIQARIEEEKLAKEAAIQAEIAANAEKDRLANQQKLDQAALEAKLEADKQAAMKKANKLKKQQSIIEAIINTAISVVSALKSGFPLGLIMAGVYAALGAVQIATIKKQPDYAEGGYTKKGGKYEVAGTVHAGEYVVPQKVVRNPQAQGMLNVLESMRKLPGYADGGPVAAVPNVPTTDNMLDYKRIGDEVSRALKENPMFVSWQEWKSTDDKMRWVINRAGIGK